MEATRGELTKREYRPLIPALDVPTLDDALGVLKRVGPYVDVVKLGLQLFLAEGPQVVTRIKEEGFEVFLDLKLNDIPNTVAKACQSIAPLEPLMLTLHTMGGQEMLRSAKQALRSCCDDKGYREPWTLGVTVLTSLDLLAMRKIGVGGSVEGEVIRLARLASASGMQGLVVSPHEIAPVIKSVGTEMVIVTPGVRLLTEGVSDQKRVDTPKRAFSAGADFIVMGRPLLEADDPGEVARAVLEKMKKRST